MFKENYIVAVSMTHSLPVRYHPCNRSSEKSRFAISEFVVAFKLIAITYIARRLLKELPKL